MGLGKPPPEVVFCCILQRPFIRDLYTQGKEVQGTLANKEQYKISNTNAIVVHSVSDQ